MHIVAHVSANQKQQLRDIITQTGNELIWIDSNAEIPEADLYIDWQYELGGDIFSHIKEKPVIINAVSCCYTELPENYIRINGWPGCWEKGNIEVAKKVNQEMIETIFSTIGWNCLPTNDIPGLIAPRIIAMIINEAYFTFGADVSSKSDIDTAMKLGTNYPYGPFEWCEKIGVQSVYRLLKRLQEDDNRYEIAPELTKAVII